ncbi:hypothetical protein FE257_003960 [Aspergillus nanangensis]|uniref:Zn(2)-C6 fungal-type domain-containing protein n=1 Tax=Aspergillus nanangensis TaxID=2582783 RepID=A0AAD4GXE6_ASPNN|nr:hypothetical protein FE257_003960 [Aspergillus nanangensis]
MHMMSSAISCNRCKTKKIRCNRISPRCDKCIAIDAECIYLPRKPRTKNKPSVPHDNNNVLAEILNRLDRLENHCSLGRIDPDQAVSIPRSRSVSTFDWEEPEPGPSDAQSSPAKQDELKSLLSSNLFYQLRYVAPLFENAACAAAVDTALASIAATSNQGAEPSSLQISKEKARQWMDLYHDTYHFEGFRQPLERGFLTSIPDLLEIPHVTVSPAAQIIYYSVILQGIMLDAEYADKGPVVQCLYQKSMGVAEVWLDQVQNTPTDLYAAFFMISKSLEGCNTEMSWRTFRQACIIAQALGYFSVDSPATNPTHHPPGPSLAPAGKSVEEDSSEVEKNRKRFEFWHLLRLDCLFRLHFGRPAVITQGSWAVNFPDPTINGVDDASTRFLQIHFLALMRLTLINLRFLEWKDAGGSSDEVGHDETVDGFIGEVQEIMASWNPEDLLASTTNHVDMWFCVDIIFSTYQMLIIFYQSKRGHQDGHMVLQNSVDIAKKSVRLFQSRLGSGFFVYWGVSLVLLHQFMPFLVLSSHIIAGTTRDDDEARESLTLVTWLDEFVQKAAAERPETRSIGSMFKALTAACQDRLRRNKGQGVLAGAV